MKAKAPNTIPISLRIEQDVLDNLKQIARFESFDRNADITYVDLIREAVLNAYPLPKTDESIPQASGS